LQRKGVCTANDVKISQITLLSAGQSCNIGDVLTIDIAVQWSSTANGRYDVAAYIARDGGNALQGAYSWLWLWFVVFVSLVHVLFEGACNEFILSPIGPNPVFGTQASPSSGPFQELNNDQCGDLDSSTVVWQRVNGVTITCRDQDHNGVADVVTRKKSNVFFSFVLISLLIRPVARLGIRIKTTTIVWVFRQRRLVVFWNVLMLLFLNKTIVSVVPLPSADATVC
jgi:hypothetical protein